MSEPFLAEVRIMGFNFAPRGWAFCDGQILPINQNQSLYSLLGTTYGGDGRTSFALPDLRGRTPVHEGNGFALGQKGGEETHTLTASETPSHNHPVSVSTAGATKTTVSGSVMASTREMSYANYAAGSQTAMASSMISSVGGQAHENMQPYLAINFCIAIRGLFPSRN